MKIILRMVGYGALIWFIGYAAGFLAFPLIETYFLFFKTLMIVAGAAAGALCTVLYFKKVDAEYLKEGITVGLVWLVVNWLLDFLFLLPMSQQPVGQYMVEIGLRYLAIPAMTITVGYLLQSKIRS